MRRILTLILALSSCLSLTGANTLNLDKKWVIEAPEDWWFSEVTNRDGLRLYTYGLESPDPLKDTIVMLVDARTMKGTNPKLIRGISMGIALQPMAEVIVQGSERYARAEKGGMLTEGFRKEVSTISGKLVLVVFVFTAAKLPGEPLPDSDSRLVIVHVAGKTDAEVENFIKVFETVKPWVAESENKPNSNPQPAPVAAKPPAGQEDRQP